MKRRLIWWFVGALALVTLATAVFLRNFEQVSYERVEAAKNEARGNAYLALERLLGRLGRPMTRITSPHLLDELPAGGVVLLDRFRVRHVAAWRADRLLAWVDRGGYLIVAGELYGADPLLAKLGARHAENRSQECEPGGEAAAAQSVAPQQTRPWIDVRLPDSDVVYRYRSFGRQLAASDPAPAWRAGASASNRSALMHYAWGAGHITVIDGLDAFTNYRLGDHDHAELLWALIERYQPRGEIRLATGLEVKTLWQWLAETAWATLASAALLIAIWLWRIVPRFGAVLPAAVEERRELTQHLAAIGRCVWREGGLGHWLGTVRQALAARLMRRHPQLAPLDARAQETALAKLAGSSPQDIRAAFTDARADSPKTFTAWIQTLQRLDRQL